MKAEDLFESTRRELNSLNKEYSVSYQGELTFRVSKVDFDIEENLYSFLEKIELGGDKEGILKEILEEIKKL